MSLPRTPSQTVGPFFAFALPWVDGPFVVPEGTPGAIWLRGRVLDGDGEPVPDALVETWQADGAGGFGHAGGFGRAMGEGEGTGGTAAGGSSGPSDSSGPSGVFRGFGRCPTDEQGRFAILTLKPGRVPAPDGTLQAPHIDVSIFARGLLKGLLTRAYFDDEVEANAADPVLAGLVSAPRRGTLVAERTNDGYRLDVHLQGERETVFFDV